MVHSQGTAKQNKNKKSALVLKLLGIYRLLIENVAKIYDKNPQDQKEEEKEKKNELKKLGKTKQTKMWL